MNKVIPFPDQTDLKRTSYIDDNGDLGISTRDRKLGVYRLNDNEFEVVTPDGSQLHSRDSLAELMWVAAIFLDSKERWKPSLDLVGCNYD